MSALWIGLALAVASGLSWLLFIAGRRRFPEAPAALARHETLWIAAEDGALLEAWLMLPSGVERPPVVLMAPGLTGTKEGPLEVFAARFVAAGFAALLIDFRSFGGSEGSPRHHVDPVRQLADYRSVIRHIRAALQDRVDTDRIVAWGASFSGTAAICAAEAESLHGVIAQVPWLGGEPVHAPDRRQIAGYIALSIAEAIGDALARLMNVRLPPVYITTYGRPGERTFAMSRDNPSAGNRSALTHPFWQAMPRRYRGGWANQMLVRGLRNLDAIDPRRAAAVLECPVLLIGATRDDMISIDAIRAVGRALRHPLSRVVELDAGHYDPYVAALLDRNVEVQLTFLREITTPPP